MKLRTSHLDPWLLIWGAFATVMGLFWIFDAGYARSVARGSGVLPGEFTSQLMYCAVAAIVFLIGSRVSGKFLEKSSGWFWAGSFVLLLLVHVIGKEMNGARRWIDIGPVHLQPSEFAKIGAILYLGGVYARYKPFVAPKLRRPSFAQKADRLYLPQIARTLPFLTVLLAAMLVEKEPDLGTAAVIGVIAFAMVFAGGVSVRKLSMLFAGLVVVTIIGIRSEPFRMERITNHATRWSADNVRDSTFQTIQAEYAIADGGLSGVGLGNGRVKHIIPAPTTDFILATIGEEGGLFMVLLVLSVLFALCWRMFQLSARAPTRFGSLVLIGTGCWIGVQTCVNVLMASAKLPAIGIPLPFVSSGGSSLAVLWLALGLCNAVMAPQRVEEAVDARDRDGWRDRRSRLSSA